MNRKQAEAREKARIEADRKRYAAKYFDVREFSCWMTGGARSHQPGDSTKTLKRGPWSIPTPMN